MKKVLASLLVLVSLASFGSVASFSDSFYTCARLNDFNLKLPENCYSVDECIEKTIEKANKIIEDKNSKYRYRNELIDPIKFDPSEAFINNEDCNARINRLNEWLKHRNEFEPSYFKDLYAGYFNDQFLILLEDFTTEKFNKDVHLPLIKATFPSSAKDCDNILQKSHKN